MTLKRQLFISFIFVALLPMIVMPWYLYQTTIQLATDLYKQNLCNSTEIQTDILNEHVRQFIIEAKRFAGSSELKAYLAFSGEEPPDILATPNMVEEIARFTDNSLDSVITFAIIDAHGHVRYQSGSGSDVRRLDQVIDLLPPIKQQMIFDLPWDDEKAGLIIATPISVEEGAQGLFVSVYANDYFLKTISAHKQLESSNSFIYCTEHRIILTAKQEIAGSLSTFMQAVSESSAPQGLFESELDGVKSYCCYKRIAHTPWILVNSLPMTEVRSVVRAHVSVSVLVSFLVLALVVLLSRRQSRHILLPLNRLLTRVEDFFLSGATVIVTTDWDKKTEIGYLGDKFTRMAADIAATQRKLSESNYLYEALLQATYEASLTIDLDRQTISSSSEELNDWLNQLGGLAAREKLLRFVEVAMPLYREQALEIVRGILERKLKAPAEFELCFDEAQGQRMCWFRVIAVPILHADGRVVKAVFHFENITNQKCEALRLIESSQRDTLCGLLNKQTLLAMAQKFAVGKVAKNTAFFIDLDNFKQVNDTLGHAAGDAVLVEVAQRLTNRFRNTDLIGRYGGDEFVVFAPGMTREIAELKANTLLGDLSLTLEVADGAAICLTASIGVCLSARARSPEWMIDCADKAMYTAKQQGKHQVSVWDSEEECV
ncbi:MAG: diguanylate cyclase [Clostridia bacterium]